MNFKPIVFFTRPGSQMRIQPIFMILIGAGLLASALWGGVHIARAETHDEAVSTGELLQAGGADIFRQKCAGCHTIGAGKLVGPDLKGVMERRESDWVKTFLLDTNQMLDNDPAAQELLKEYNNVRMPNMGLSVEEVDQLLVFLGNPGDQPIGGAAQKTGNSLNGKALFTGEKLLEKGGPYCLACHSVYGATALGGGALGPDLTHVVGRLGEAGLAGSLQTIAYPTMAGPFKDRPLTDQERADLVEFLKEANLTPEQAANPAAGALTMHAGLIFAIGIGLMGVFFGVMLFAWTRIKTRYFPRLPLHKV